MWIASSCQLKALKTKKFSKEGTASRLPLTQDCHINACQNFQPNPALKVSDLPDDNHTDSLELICIFMCYRCMLS